MNKRTDWLWEIFYFLEDWGYYIGFAMIISPIVWDILWKGLRSGENIKVCLGGVICQIAGLIVIGISRKIRRWGR